MGQATVFHGYRPPPARTGACWVIEDVSDEVAGMGRLANSVHIQRMIAATPREDEYLCDHATRIAARLGLTNYQAEKLSMEALILSKYPRLLATFLEGHYTPMAISKVADYLVYVPDGVETDVEADVLQALAPTVINQCPLTPKQVAKRMLAVLAVHCPDSVPEELRPGFKRSSPDFRITRGETETHIAVTLPIVEGEAIERLITKTADKYCITPGEALIRLILGQADVQITLNLFKNADEPTGSIFGAGVQLVGEEAEAWETRATHVRTIAPSATDGYAPTGAQRAFLEGRDVHCRFPGCEVPAHRCDIDHIHRHSDGGPTHTDNLHLLCRRHHNLKTAGTWDVSRYPDSTEVWSSRDDGHMVTTSAEGPLARVTFAESLTRKRQRAEQSQSDYSRPISPAFPEGDDFDNYSGIVQHHLEYGMPTDEEPAYWFKRALVALYHWAG